MAAGRNSALIWEVVRTADGSGSWEEMCFPEHNYFGFTAGSCCVPALSAISAASFRNRCNRFSHYTPHGPGSLAIDLR